MGQISGCSLSGSSGSTCFKVLAAAAASSEYSNGKELLQAHTVVGRIQRLTDDWTEGLSSSLTAGQNLPFISYHVGFSTGQLTTWQLTLSE